MTPRRNVLIFHSGALGDFIVTWPLAMALGRLHPQSRIFYVAASQKGALAEKFLRLDAIDSETGWHALHAMPANLPEVCLNRLAAAHSIYSFISTGDDAWAQNVRELSPQVELICLNSNPPEDFAGHVSEWILQQLASRFAVHSAMKQMLASVAERGVTTRNGASKTNTVLIHPGAGSPLKCWPAERFVELIGKLKSTGRDVSVVLGEAELEKFPAEAVAAFCQSARTVQPANYLALAEEILSAGAFIGNDSGPGHLAGVLGTVTLSLFGPSNPARWRPMGPRTTVIQQNPLQTLNVQPVYDWVENAPGQRG